MPRPAKSPSQPDLASSTPSPLHRLPVNPRRKKVAPDERKRVATACNSCNVRRIKCSGHSPCNQCSGASRECRYPLPVAKVTIPKSQLEALQRRVATLEGLMRNAGVPVPPPDPEAETPEDSTAQANPTSPTAVASRADASPHADTLTASMGEALHDDIENKMALDTEGKMLLDPDGTPHYLGKTSGATFLGNLREFMTTSTRLALGIGFLESVGRPQTFDSRRLEIPSDGDVDSLRMPTRPEMDKMLADFRWFIQDGNGTSQCGGIYFWPLADLDLLLAALGPKGPQSGWPTPAQGQRRLALFQAVFAYATLLNLTGPNSVVRGRLGEIFFARARKLLGNPLDVTSYAASDVAVLALMALYLVENNRRDDAYMYISIAMHLSIMHGLYRGSSAGPAEQRTFWTLYILDRWLSCLMGRPPAISDEAIKLPLPEECQGLPSSVGLRAHVELSRISSYIVRSSYAVGQSSEQALEHVRRAQEMLRDWKERLPEMLKLPDSLAHVEGLDRSFCTLHMAYNQLVILIVRPAFLTAVKKTVAGRFVRAGRDRDDWTHEYTQEDLLRECSDSARLNILLAQRLREMSPGMKLLMQDLHHLFNAAIILMMHQIVFLNLRTNDTKGIDFAIQVFEAEASTGSNYSIDCLTVLRDLNKLVWGLRPVVFDEAPQGPIPGGLAPQPSIIIGGPPPFPLHGLGAGLGHPRQLPIPLLPISPPLGPEETVMNQLETWWHVHDMDLYRSGGCMVDA